MEPALGVTTLWLLFAATHIGLATRRVREVLLARFGEPGFNLVFSLIAAATFTPLVSYYATHRFAGAPGLALAQVAALRPPLVVLVVIGVVLAGAGLVVFPASPMAPFRHDTRSPRGLQRITRHPFFAGVALAAAAHALLATRLAGTAFFAGLALFAAAGGWHQDRKLLRLRGAAYADYLAATSALPFAAVLAGRQRLIVGELPVVGIAAGVAVALGLRAVHGAIFADGGARVIATVIGGAAILGLQSWRAVRRRERRPPAERQARRLDEAVPRRQALATACAALLAYVGIAHEVVGARLYPDGPASFGGPLGWHAAGLSLVGLGFLAMGGTLRLVRVPVVPFAVVGIVAGAVVLGGDAVLHGGFHFFASTMVVAGVVLALTAGRRGTA